MADRAYVLLSGGMDSTTCLFLAEKEVGAHNVSAFSVDYGQIHKRELDYAANLCHELHIPHQVLKLSPQPASPLTEKTRNEAIPDKPYDELGSGISPSYHFFRNAQLLSLITAYADADLLKGQTGLIYAGPHAEDAANWAYADCTPEFLGAMANAIFIGTYQRLRLCTPLMWLTKTEIVELGDRLNVPWEMTYSCYHGGSEHCGVCPTCQSRRDAFLAAGVDDPTVYEIE